MPAKAGIQCLSGVELDDVAVRDAVLASDVLTRDPGPAPDARVLERVREILVHQPRNVLHRLALA
jgi:hypothetical protein